MWFRYAAPLRPHSLHCRHLPGTLYGTRTVYRSVVGGVQHVYWYGESIYSLRWHGSIGASLGKLSKHDCAKICWLLAGDLMSIWQFGNVVSSQRTPCMTKNHIMISLSCVSLSLVRFWWNVKFSYRGVDPWTKNSYSFSDLYNWHVFGDVCWMILHVCLPSYTSYWFVLTFSWTKSDVVCPMFLNGTADCHNCHKLNIDLIWFGDLSIHFPCPLSLVSLLIGSSKWI